jgi:hypothetical protein
MLGFFFVFDEEVIRKNSKDKMYESKNKGLHIYKEEKID